MNRGSLCFAIIAFTCAAPVQAQAPITALAFAPGGEQLVVASQAGAEVRSWPKLEVIQRLATKLHHINDAVFSPDGKQLLLAGGSPSDFGDVELHAWPLKPAWVSTRSSPHC
jgi:hypothetical protein